MSDPKRESVDHIRGADRGAPTSADVRAAVERLRKIGRDGAKQLIDDPVDGPAALQFIDDLALLTERVARLEAWIQEEGNHRLNCAVRKWARLTLRPKPKEIPECDCGLDALLPPATEGR